MKEDKWQLKSLDEDKFEHWLDRHHYELELIRTLCSMVAAGSSVIVLLRIFGII